MSNSTRERPKWSSSQSEPKEHAVFGVAIYLAIAVGNTVYKLFEYVLASDDSALYFARDDDVLFHAFETAFSIVNGGTGLMIALLLGGFYYFAMVSDEPPFKPAAIAAAAGTLVVLVVLLVVMVVLAPDGADLGFGDELLGLVASTVGAAATAAVAGVALERFEDVDVA